MVLVCVPDVLGGENHRGSETLRSEAIEWGLIFAPAAGGLLISRFPAWPEEPLLASSSTDRPYLPETVSDEALVAGAGILAGILAVVPGYEEMFTPIAYNNFKGYAQALSLNLLLYSTVKSATGRVRPSGDNFPEDKARDARKSFYSGHASTSFAAATYASLYAFQHLGTNGDPWWIAGKAAFATGLGTLATWVSYTRVDDNRHFVSDVVTGGMMGAAIASSVYFFRNRPAPQDSSRHNGNDRLSLEIGPNRVAMRIVW